MLKLGYAQADITPSAPMPLIGFNREDDLSRGVLEPLLAQVAVWQGEQRCCLVCIDSIGFAKYLSDRLRGRVAAALEISAGQVMLCFSHCHSAPDPDRRADYYEMVCARVEQAAKRALAGVQPVLAGWANAQAEIGVNRRQGSTQVDRRVGILKLCGPEQDLRLLCVRLTAHCNVLKRDNYLVSPDYFGAVRTALGQKYHCPVMVIQGSAGNIAPRYFDSETTPMDAQGPEYIRSRTALQEMAQIVCEKASQQIEGLAVAADVPAAMYTHTISLYAPVLPPERAEQIAAEAKQYCDIDGAGWLQEVGRLHRAGVTRQEDRCEIQYFSVGPWCLCGVPYELMVEFALEAAQRTEDEFFYVNGYTNGCMSYFPTAEEYELGGYEVYWSLLIYYPYFNRAFPLEKQAASRLLEEMIRAKRPAAGLGERAKP